LPGIKDKSFKDRVRRQAQRLKADLDRSAAAVRKTIERELGKPNL
jgi:hypothetical protein